MDHIYCLEVTTLLKCQFSQLIFRINMFTTKKSQQTV